MFKNFWREHFKLKQFYPIYENPIVFIVSQWQLNKNEASVLYLLYRMAVTILFFVTWMITMVKDGNEKWAIFLTNWGYTLCTLQAFLSCFMLCLYVISTKLSNPNLKTISLKIYPVYWIINTIATPTAFGITTLYWTVIYNPDKNKFDSMNYFVHGNNSIMMMLDLWIVSHPLRILHFIYPALFSVLYTIFTAIYYMAGGISRDGTRCIYKIVDWDKPLPTALICLGVILYLVVLHLLSCLISSIRIRLFDKCWAKKEDVPTMMDTKEHAAYVNKAITNDDTV